MRRALPALLIALTTVAVLSPPAVAVTPTVGHYRGEDDHGRGISFDFNGTQLHHVKLDETVIFHGIPVHDGRFHHQDTTFVSSYTISGEWVHSKYVKGTLKQWGHEHPFHVYWRHGLG